MQIQIRIERIDIISFEIKPPAAGILFDQFKIDVSLNLHLIETDKVAANFVQVNIFDSTHVHNLAKLIVVFACRIENFDECFPIVENIRTASNEAKSFVDSLSIATTRGILYSQLRGTYLDKAIMPVINLSDLKPVPIEQQPVKGKEAKTKT